MDSNKKTVDSLYKLLEQMKIQNETAKKSLIHYLETELDRTFNQMVTSMMMWAFKNIPNSSSRITDMLSLLESTEEKTPESPEELPDVDAHQKENIGTIEPAVLSQEIIQLSDESIFNVSSDEDEQCGCKECYKSKKNTHKAQEKCPVKTEICDESSQLSDVTHISDSQPQLDEFFDDQTIKQEASQNSNPLNLEITESTLQKQCPFSTYNVASTNSTEQLSKKTGSRILVISLNCQNKACNKIFLSEEALQSHMESVHHVLPYMCLQRRCHASFTTQ